VGEGGGNAGMGLKVSVPLVPGLSAEVPIRWSFFRPIVKLFRRASAEQLVRVIGARAYVHIQADDDGLVETFFLVVNRVDRPVRVDGFHLELFYVDHYATGVAQPLFKAPVTPIPPLDVGEVNVTISLTSAAIRGILQRMQKAQNAYSSPRIELTFGGKLDLNIPGSLAALQRAKTIRLPFQVDVRPIELSINPPSIRG
jgi:hypothetical protein